MSEGFLLSDEGRIITVTNDSTTTAISAGDVVYATTNDDVLGTTSSGIPSNYSATDIKVKAAKWSNTAYKTVIGVAITDIDANDKGSIATDGLFIHQAQENIEAGQAVQFYEGTANKLQVNDAGTTAGYSESQKRLEEH